MVFFSMKYVASLCFSRRLSFWCVRYTYAEFWQAIIKRDVEAIRTAATALGVGELYGLFACMVTARSWNAIQRGMEVSLPSE